MAPSAIDGHTNGHANGSLNAKATSFTPAVDSKYHASSSQEAMTVEAEYAAHNYHPLPIVFAKAQGTSVWDPEGKHYLDFLSAYSAVNQGHCHPKLIQALTEQASRLTLSSRAFYNDVFPKFAEKVTSMMGFEMVLPMNTGAEAVETVVKIARKWGYKVKGIPQDKALVLSVKENFHGRTFSAITMSTDPESKENYGPYLPGLGSVCPATGKPLPFNDADALEEALEHHGKEVAAFLVEPIQGEAGIVVPDESYLKKVRELCTKHNVLLICDEIQTGIARTGRLLCHEWSGIKPDLVLLGKAISGGMYPVSCVLGSKEVMLTVEPGTHGSTYGGNPLGSAVAIKALEIIEEEQLTERAERLGEIFRQGLRDIQKRDPMISLIRGKGLLNAIVIDESKTNGHSAWDLCMLMKEKGLLVSGDLGRFKQSTYSLTCPIGQADAPKHHPPGTPAGHQRRRNPRRSPYHRRGRHRATHAAERKESAGHHHCPPPHPRGRHPKESAGHHRRPCPRPQRRDSYQEPPAPLRHPRP
jgi:ornithine--oxo-acid transaminase